MCLQLFFIVLQVLALKPASCLPYKDYIVAYIPVEELPYLTSSAARIEIPVPYSNAFTYDPWNFGMMPPYPPYSLYDFWNYPDMRILPFHQTTGPVTFGGPVRAKGSVHATGRFLNTGFNNFQSYSAPPTPATITPQPTCFFNKPLPTITSLPAVTLPTTVKVPTTANMPSNLSVPTKPLPCLLATKFTSTLPVIGGNDIESSITVVSDVNMVGNSASNAGMPMDGSVKFRGMVPASGHVRMSAHFS